jgi:hypothetical protein
MLKTSIQRPLSLLIATGYVISSVIQVPGFTFDVFTVCLLSLLSLALIWFPDEIGDATGYWSGSSLSMTQVDTPSPAILISILGWLFLTSPLALWFFI